MQSSCNVSFIFRKTQYKRKESTERRGAWSWSVPAFTVSLDQATGMMPTVNSGRLYFSASATNQRHFDKLVGFGFSILSEIGPLKSLTKRQKAQAFLCLHMPFTP